MSVLKQSWWSVYVTSQYKVLLDGCARMKIQVYVPQVGLSSFAWDYGCFNATFNNIVVSFLGGRNRYTWRKPAPYGHPMT